MRLRRHLETVEKTAGRQSAVYNDAQAGYAALLTLLGKKSEALNAYAAACAYEPDADAQAEERKDWLTFMGDWGGALSAAGQAEAAEAVLRRALAGRERFYGRSHPGYAFGLEPLARHLLENGRPQDALPLQREAAQNFHASGHPRFLSAVTLLSAMETAAGIAPDALQGLPPLSPESVEEMARAAPGLLERLPNAIRQPTLSTIAALALERCGADNQAALSLLAHIANNETEAGADADHAMRQNAAHLLVEAFERQNRPAELAQALMGLALAQSGASDIAGAAASYDRARDIGLQRKDDALVAQSERNHGLMLAETGDRMGAEARLRAALLYAERSGSAERIGEAECALGIFLQHGREYEAARPLLQAALNRLPGANSNAIYARSHLTALDQNTTCGCDGMEEALETALCASVREQIDAALPGLLESLAFSGDNDGGPSLHVRLSRKPSDSEMERLHILVTQAEAAFKKGLLERR